MDNKMSLHIVWPFVILWIVVAAMVGGDLIPLHIVDGAGGVNKVMYLVDELAPVDDVDLSEQFNNMDQVEPIDSTTPVDSTNNPWDSNPLTDQILEDSIVSKPTDDTVSNDGIPQDSIAEITYILNTNSMKFHKVDCHSAELIAPENFQESFDSRDTIIANGYIPCKNCNP